MVLYMLEKKMLCVCVALVPGTRCTLVAFNLTYGHHGNYLTEYGDG